MAVMLSPLSPQRGEEKMRMLIYMGLTALVLIGCGKKADETAPAVRKAYAELAPSDVMVRVNGKDLLKSHVEEEIAYKIGVLRAVSGLVGPKQIEAARRQIAKSAVRQFISDVVLEDAARVRGVKRTEADFEFVKGAFTNSLPKGMTYEKVVASLSAADRRAFLGRMERDTLKQAMRNALMAEQKVTVDDAEIRARQKAISEANETAMATNRLLWAMATNTWRRIEAGEPFEKVAARLADVDHMTADVEWGPLNGSDYVDDPELYKYITTLPIGGLTPPFEGDNGILILRLKKVLPPDPKENRKETQYVFNKVFFELAETWKVEPEEESRRLLTLFKADEAYRQALKALTDAARIEYPNGKISFNDPRRRMSRRDIPANVPVPGNLKGI